MKQEQRHLNVCQQGRNQQSQTVRTSYLWWRVPEKRGSLQLLTSSATSYIRIKKLLCGSKGKLNFAWRVYISSYEEKDRFFFNSQQKRQTIVYL